MKNHGIQQTDTAALNHSHELLEAIHRGDQPTSRLKELSPGNSEVILFIARELHFLAEVTKTTKYAGVATTLDAFHINLIKESVVGNAQTSI